MADKFLHGNGSTCSACELRRERLAPFGVHDVGCNACDGDGRLERSAAEIVAEAVARARVEYWPVQEAKWAREGGP